MVMKLTLAFIFILISWSSAEACSIMPLKAERENTYEQNLELFFTDTHRNMVDKADNIVVGTFRYSESKRRHSLLISKSLKKPESIWSSIKVSVSFEQIDDDRVEYEKRNPELYFDEFILDWFWPINYPHGVEGSYGPGDCKQSLNIISDAEYLIFANEDFEIFSMLLLRKSKLHYKTAIENLVENPLDRYGVSFTLNQMLDRGSNVQLLSTAQCLPAPTYKITKSSNLENEGKTFAAQPIQIFGDIGERYPHELSDPEKKAASNKGIAEGLYTNAPSMKECRIGQKYLMLGQFLYSRTNGTSGQMIAEDNGYFQLKNTAYEHHISPELISYDSVVKILNEQSTP